MNDFMKSIDELVKNFSKLNYSSEQIADVLREFDNTIKSKCLVSALIQKDEDLQERIQTAINILEDEKDNKISK